MVRDQSTQLTFWQWISLTIKLQCPWKDQVKGDYQATISSTAEPPKFDRIVRDSDNFKNEQCNAMFLFWMFLRKQNAHDQAVPKFSGWLLRNRQKEIPRCSLKKTVETYLPPIASKVTDLATIQTYIEYLKALSLPCNMPYVNITLDVGAAINAFKFVWSSQLRFTNVVIHLGDFHFKK